MFHNVFGQCQCQIDQSDCQSDIRLLERGDCMRLSFTGGDNELSVFHVMSVSPVMFCMSNGT